MMHYDVNDKKWNVARQKALSTIGEAFKLMTVNGEITQSMSTQEFVEKVIPKYLKLEKTCSITKAKECGISTAANFYKTANNKLVQLPTEWNTSTYAAVLNGSSTILYTQANYSKHYQSYIFRTLDGLSVNFFYNPYCAVDLKDKYSSYNNDADFYFQYSLDTACFMGVYDMNGLKKPNKVGMDIGFVGSFYNGYGVKSAAVLPYKNDKVFYTFNAGIEYCKNLDKINHRWIAPDINELSLMYLNIKLLDGTLSNSDRFYFSRTQPTKNSASKMLNIHFWNGSTFGRGLRNATAKSGYGGSPRVWCVRNNT